MNLPRAFCVGKNLDRTIEELERMNSQMIPEWQESFWIKGELVLLLNEAYSAELCGFHIMYTQEEGLRYGKEEEHYLNQLIKANPFKMMKKHFVHYSMIILLRFVCLPIAMLKKWILVRTLCRKSFSVCGKIEKNFL